MRIYVNGRYIFNHAVSVNSDAKEHRFKALERLEDGNIWIVMETGNLRGRKFSVREGRLQADCRPYAINKGAWYTTF